MKWINKGLSRLYPAYGHFLFNRAIRKIGTSNPIEALLAYDARTVCPSITPLSDSLHKQAKGNGAVDHWKRLTGEV